MAEMNLLVTGQSRDYELLDSGEGQKLERFGSFSIARPDPQALWPKRLPDFAWGRADATFHAKSALKGSGKGSAKGTTAPEWKKKAGTPERWNVSLGGLDFYVKPTSFKHVGIFPEQLSNWHWIGEQITRAKKADPKRKISVLNLFGYTGGATLAAAKAGAEVVHVDGSKVAIGWAKENAELSKLDKKPIRWILDDARAFVKREIKRGNRYDGIIMDPPAFGHGPKKESWKIEEDLLALLNMCKTLLSEQPIFFLVNGYASGYSSVAYYNNLSHMFGTKGSISAGELLIEESGTGRLLPAGIFARWSSEGSVLGAGVRNEA